MPLFEIAVLIKPTRREAEEGKSDELVIPPKCITALSPDAAVFRTLLDNADLLRGYNVDQIEVITSARY